MSEYLENEKNKDIYKDPVNDLKTKIVGALKDPYFNPTGFNSIKDYDSYDDLIKDLQSGKLDGIVLNDILSDKAQMMTPDLSKVSEQVDKVDHVYGFQKDKTELLNEFNQYLKDTDSDTKWKNKWEAASDEAKYIDKNLSGSKGTLKVLYRLDNEPYAYKDDKGEPAGIEIERLYRFAKNKSYSIEFKEAQTADDLKNGIQQKSADIYGGLIPTRDNYKEDLAYSNPVESPSYHVVARTENLKESNDKYYETTDDLDGELLGVLKDSTLSELTKENFPKSKCVEKENTESKCVEKENTDELVKALLNNEIEGFLVDQPIAENLKLKYPDRITYFLDSYDENDLGFGFKQNDQTQLKDKFNECLKTAKFDEIYKKWNVSDTSDLTIDKNLEGKAGNINAAFLMSSKPLCFEEKGEAKGAEVELLYDFAKKNDYTINFTPINQVEDRINYLKNDKADITGGWFSVTEDRAKEIDFSDSILKTGVYLVVRKDSKKDEMSLKVLDPNNDQKKNNAADVKVKFPNKETNSSCVFPEKFNDTIIINCTISDVKDIDPYNEGFEYVSSPDKIAIGNSKYNVFDFLKANEKLPGHKVITETNKTKNVCTEPTPTDYPTDSPTDSPTTSPTDSPTASPSPSPSKGNSTHYPVNQKKKSGGLSTGAICAILIPLILLLLLATLLALLGCCKSTPATTAPFQYDKYNTSELQVIQPPVQPVTVVQPVQPVQVVQPVEVVTPVQVVQPVEVVTPVQEVQVVQPVQEVKVVQPVEVVDVVQ